MSSCLTADSTAVAHYNKTTSHLDTRVMHDGFAILCCSAHRIAQDCTRNVVLSQNVPSDLELPATGLGHSPSPPPTEVVLGIKCGQKQLNQLLECVFSHHQHAVIFGMCRHPAWMSTASAWTPGRRSPRAPPRTPQILSAPAVDQSTAVSS